MLPRVIRFEALSLTDALIVFVVKWLVSASLIWFSSRLVVGERATFTKALLIALVGPALIILTLSLTSALNSLAFSLLLTLLAWIWLIKEVYSVDWLQSIAITIVSFITLIIMTLLALFAISIREVLSAMTYIASLT